MTSKDHASGKQTWAGMQTGFKAFIAIGDYNGHIALGVKCSKEMTSTIWGTTILAKLSIIPVPVGRVYWRKNVGKPHSIPWRWQAAVVLGWCVSFLSEEALPLCSRSYWWWLVLRTATHQPGPLWATLPRPPLILFPRPTATWPPASGKRRVFIKSPYQEFIAHLVKTHSRVPVQRTQALALTTT